MSLEVRDIVVRFGPNAVVDGVSLRMGLPAGGVVSPRDALEATQGR